MIFLLGVPFRLPTSSTIAHRGLGEVFYHWTDQLVRRIGGTFKPQCRGALDKSVWNRMLIYLHDILHLLLPCGQVLHGWSFELTDELIIRRIQVSL